MNIILRELKSIRKSLIIWSSSMIFLIYVGMVKYSGFAEAGDSIEDMMASLPDSMKAIFGIGQLDLTKASGYYIVFFLYFALICGIHAVMQGAVVLSKEERDKTADFLLAKPVKRNQVITSKIIASLISVVVLNIVTWVSSIILVGIFNKGESINSEINKLMIALLLFQLVFLFIGLLVGAISRKTKKATGICTGLLLGSFLLSIIIDMYDKVDFLKYFTPFKYFDGKRIFLHGFDLEYIILSILIIIVSIVLTYKIYGKKDLHV